MSKSIVSIPPNPWNALFAETIELKQFIGRGTANVEVIVVDVRKIRKVLSRGSALNKDFQKVLPQVIDSWKDGYAIKPFSLYFWLDFVSNNAPFVFCREFQSVTDLGRHCFQLFFDCFNVAFRNAVLLVPKDFAV